LPSLSSSKTQSTTNQSSETNPWGPQEGYLKDIFTQAKGAYGEASQAQGPNGFVAQFSPDQLSVFQKMMAYGSQPSNDGGAALNAYGTEATKGALSDLGTFKPQGGTQSNIDAATAYANNPQTDAMVDAAMRDSRRVVSEQALPQVARDAAGSGNVNSNRRAISEGILSRGLAEKTADVSANIRGQAYQQGLNLAEENSQATNNAILQAMTARASGGAQAINSAGDQVAQQGGLYDLAAKGVAGQLAGQQAGFDEQAARYSFDTNSPFDALNNYYKLIGANNWGSQTSGTSNTQTTATPSWLSTIGGVAGTVGSLIKSDERVKWEIIRIGQLNDGLPVYRFRYKDDPNTVHIGLLAQDVEARYPIAVREIEGVKHVNMALATFLAMYQ
jgi:hypothetical protein